MKIDADDYHLREYVIITRPFKHLRELPDLGIGAKGVITEITTRLPFLNLYQILLDNGQYIWADGYEIKIDEARNRSERRKKIIDELI